MKRPAITRRAIRALIATAIATAVAACDLQPADIPVPGTGVGGPTYPLKIQFANVLNLPRGAKVIANGVRVGQLTDVTVIDPVAGKSTQPGHEGYVVAEVDIEKSVRLVVGTTAELRQETPLGDVHIALTAPARTTSAQLEPGATIPLSNTTQAPQIEDIMARLSTFIGSGAMTDIQDIVHKMNGVMPQDPNVTARIAGTLGSDLSNLADNQNSVHNLIAGLRSTVDDGLLHNTAILDELLTPEGVQHTTDAINTTISVIFVLTALGPLAPAVRWLGPGLESLDGTARAVVPMLFGSHPLDTGSPSNLKKLVDLIQNTIIPFADRGPKINVVGVNVSSPTSARATSPEEQTDRIIKTLRMIGAVK